MQLQTAIRLFLDSYFKQSDRSLKTLKAYECDLRQFAEFVTDNPALAAIQPEDCEAWVEHLKKRQYLAASRKRKVATLRCFFSECTRRGRISSSPLQQLRFRFPTGNGIPKSLNLLDARNLVGEVRRVAADVDQEGIHKIDHGFRCIRNWAVVELLVSTGIRVGELTSLTLDKVDLDHRTACIYGKGGRERLAFLTDDFSYRALLAYCKLRTRIQCGCDSLFVNAHGRSLSEQGVAYVLQCLAKNAGITRKLTPHMLRHTAATFLLQNGADIRIVQEFLGHASITTTQRYAHVTRDHLRATLNRLHHGRLLTT